MKKLLTILSFIFLSLIIIPTVKAEGNYIEIKMYEKKTALEY